MAQATTTADVYLKRSWGLIEEVETATEQLRKRALAHDASVQSDQTFLQGMVSTIKGSRNLTQQKTSLLNDLQLAEAEIDNAVKLDAECQIEVKGDVYTAKLLRTMIIYLRAQLEMAWGKAETAKALYYQSIQMIELPDAHYMLGLLYESEFKSADALRHFERCLELDPSGEWSVSALREANAMRNYKKKFRGSWLVFLILCVFPIPLVGGILYLTVKRK